MIVIEPFDKSFMQKVKVTGKPFQFSFDLVQRFFNKAKMHLKLAEGTIDAHFNHLWINAQSFVDRNEIIEIILIANINDLIIDISFACLHAEKLDLASALFFNVVNVFKRKISKGSHANHLCFKETPFFIKALDLRFEIKDLLRCFICMLQIHCPFVRFLYGELAQDFHCSEQMLQLCGNSFHHLFSRWNEFDDSLLLRSAEKLVDLFLCSKNKILFYFDNHLSNFNFLFFLLATLAWETAASCWSLRKILIFF